MTPSPRYFLRVRGRVTGPHSPDELERMVRHGKVGPVHEISSDQRIWRPFDARGDWRPALPLVLATPTVPASASGSDLPARGNAPAEPTRPLATLPAMPTHTAPRARPTRRRPQAIGAVIALVAMIGITTAIVAGVVSRTPELSPNGAPPALPPLSHIDASTASDDLGDALALVVTGAIAIMPDGRRAEVVYGTGTAFAVDAHGTLLTNRHVVDSAIDLGRATALREKLRSEQLLEVEPCVWLFVGMNKHVARIAYASERFDLAVLKVDDGLRFARAFCLSSDSKVPREAAVRAIGFPGAANEALSQQERVENLIRHAKNASAEVRDVRRVLRDRELQFVLTTGSVSRVFDDDDRPPRTWVQHNADINPGNSGGPLLDVRGVVVGINTLRNASASGTYFSLGVAQLAGELAPHASAATWVAGR